MVELRVETFVCGTDKESALKPLEEAAEIFGAWQNMNTIVIDDDGTYFGAYREIFGDEIADCIQACVNLAFRFGIDLSDAMERCNDRNRGRGRL